MHACVYVCMFVCMYLSQQHNKDATKTKVDAGIWAANLVLDVPQDVETKYATKLYFGNIQAFKVTIEVSATQVHVSNAGVSASRLCL